MVTGAGMPQITAIAEACARRARARDSGDRRWRHQVLGRDHQGHRRRSQLGDDRLALCRRGREPRRNHPLPGAQLQELSRHGFADRHEPGLGRALLPEQRRSGQRRTAARAWCSASAPTRTGWPSLFPKASRGACLTAGRWRRWSSSWWAACAPAWATWAAQPSRELQEKAQFVRISRRRPAREPRARRDHHARGAQLSCRVAGRGLKFWISAWWPVAVGVGNYCAWSRRCILAPTTPPAHCGGFFKLSSDRSATPAGIFSITSFASRAIFLAMARWELHGCAHGG